MSHDVAARLAALSQDHREGRLTVSAYRSLRAPLLDMLVTAEVPPSSEQVDESTTTRPRHRPPAMGALGAGGAASAAGTADASGVDPLGLLEASDPLAEASALARTNLRANAQGERTLAWRPIAVGFVLLAAVAGLAAAWISWPAREPAPVVAEGASASEAVSASEAASSVEREPAAPSTARNRKLTPMPPPLPSEPKRKPSTPSLGALAPASAVTAATASADSTPGCEPPARTAKPSGAARTTGAAKTAQANAPTSASAASAGATSANATSANAAAGSASSSPAPFATPCRDRLSSTEFGPRMLMLAGPATTGVVFAISARPVSQAQFRAFCQKTSRPYPRQPWTEDDDPVVNVTWNEARDYLVWLSSTTGKRYRLATETEWLYFVGQGKVDPRWRNGNVREWLQDIASDPTQTDSASDEPDADAVNVSNTASAAAGGTDDHDARRLVRGVSYADTATDLLSARRSRDASMRDALTGFRALREIH